MIITKIKLFNESILKVSGELVTILKSIDDPISKKLLELIGSDVKTSYNFLSLSDEVGKLTFTSDTQSQRKISNGISDSEIFSSGSKSYLGRIVGQILTDNKIPYTVHELEVFTYKFKASASLELVKDRIKVVSGEDITYWYSEKNYGKETLGGVGQLGKSCMRNRNDFFKIYTLNPQLVRLVILLDSEGKLSARALLWNYSNKFYLDRIYFTHDSERELLKKWVEKYYLFGPIDKLDLQEEVFVKNTENEDGTFDKYPYLDTFKYYNPQKRLLRVQSPEKKQGWIELADTLGGFNYLDKVWCDIEREYLPEEQCEYSQRDDLWMRKENAVFSEFMQDYLYKGDAVFSEKMNSYIHDGDAFSFWKDKDMTQSDIIHDQHISEYAFPKLITKNRKYTVEWFDNDLLKSDPLQKTLTDGYLKILLREYPISEVVVKDDGLGTYALELGQGAVLWVDEGRRLSPIFNNTQISPLFTKKYRLGIHGASKEYFNKALKKYWEMIKSEKNIQRK
jgi:hypothetical protein